MADSAGLKLQGSNPKELPMTSAPVSLLRQRMIDDMRLRQYGEKTQHDYVRELAAGGGARYRFGRNFVDYPVDERARERLSRPKHYLSGNCAHTMDAEQSALPRSLRNTAVKGGLAGWHLRAIDRLAETDLANLTVARMAAAAHLSPHHFSRAFRVSTGLAAREWLLQKRLAAATTLLISTSCTVDQIATRVGYSSGSQFSRIFRAKLGISPQEFRRR